MADLIDRTAALERFKAENYARSMIAIVREAPTVDAVEVVRCKDCVGKAHWYKNDYGCAICGLSGLFVVEDNDFCSYGERKEQCD